MILLQNLPQDFENWFVRSGSSLHFTVADNRFKYPLAACPGQVLVVCCLTDNIFTKGTVPSIPHL